MKDNGNINDRLKNIENERNNLFNSFKHTQQLPSFEDNNINPNNTNRMYQNMINSRKNNNMTLEINESDNDNMNLLSYNAEDINGLINDNPIEYNSNFNLDSNPMDLYKLQSEQRQSDESDYKNLLNQKSNFEKEVQLAEKKESVDLKQITEERNKKGKEFYESLQYNSGNLSRPDSFMFKDVKFRDDSNNFDLKVPKQEMTRLSRNPKSKL